MIDLNLPVKECWPELRAALRDQGRAVLTAPPGSGKTTLLPLLLLNEQWLAGRVILMLEPRRLAARMAADRMATLLGEESGQSIGYRIRFERRISAATRIEVLTEGILTRMLQDDPALERAGLLIFDEFHERSLHGDLALTLCLDSISGLRPDLRILVMSATLEVEALSRLLADAPIIRGGGRSFPVTTRHLAVADRSPTAPGYSFSATVRATSSAIRLALAEQSGDLLAFLPGAREIRAVAANLAGLAAAGQIRLRPLYGELPRAEQDRAVLPDPAGGRRVVLATNIAETSLTIEGVTTVVDSGWGRVVRFDPDSGLAKLVSERVSRASATQRAGRAGRLGPGYCYRLWDQGIHHTLKAQNRPEILATDLCRLVLELAAWGVNDPSTLRWLDPPPVTALARARELLVDLEVLDGRGNLTPHGKKLATLPLHPRLAHLLLVTSAMGHQETACDLAALLSERDLLRGIAGKDQSVDLDLRLQVLTAFRKGSMGEVRAQGGDADLCRKVDQASRQLRQLCPGGGVKPKSPQGIGSLLACAYPDRVAGLRSDSRERYLLASGRGAKLPGDDALAGSPWLVAATLDADRQEGRIFLAATISLEELRRFHPGQITVTSEVEWDERDCLTSRQVERFLALPLATRAGHKITPEQALPLLLSEIEKRGLELLPWTPAARELQARLSCLRQWQPEGGWPDCSDSALIASLAEWLGPWLNKITCLEQLTRLDLSAILAARLDWQQGRKIDELAPTHLLVPSGSRVRLQYRPGDNPLLAVRLQEVFGLADTPRICAGQIPVILQLLSPAKRPVQVTSDLKNFWNTTYREVKKELQGRYPRHHWPDDPWTAAPTARVKRRPGK